MGEMPRRTFLRHGALAALGMSAVRVASAAETAGTESKSLFDGKTFTGWEGNLEVFRIEDGAIVGGSLKGPVAHNEFLSTKEAYGDFELTLKVRLLGKDANAGVQIRSKRIPNDFEMIGYQADLGETYWGCLYDESRRKKVLTGPTPEVMQKIVKQEEWNDYRIRCEGRRVRLWLNGTQTVDYTEPDETLEQKGLIAVQIHGGGPSEAWYEEIRLREL